MKKELTKEQIDTIYDFVEKQGKVPYYDVQIEIVDHMANDIESQMELNPNISFNEAFRFAFKKFGLSGFQKLIEENHNKLQKEYGKMLFSWFLKYFSFPRIMFSLFLFGVIFSLVSLFNESINFMVVNGFFLGIYTILFLRKIIVHKFLQKDNKKWLLQKVLYGANSTGFLTLNFMYQFFLLSSFFNSINGYKIIFISIAYTISIILLDIIVRIIPNHSDKLLKEKYLKLV
ncbi:hypothetical protein [Aureivirga sp. CE67]|uniref:hypothetical protein n=1 Tax=Aureivirga sp. CE67 TaxID=1788983 RepID=UPI0018CADB64|nr:hypothetical protein [Aureivirga sp. CE67]